jgi:hypothetical protein
MEGSRETTRKRKRGVDRERYLKIPRIEDLVRKDNVTETIEEVPDGPNGSICKVTMTPENPKVYFRLLWGKRKYPIDQPLPQDVENLHWVSAYALTCIVLTKLTSLQKTKKSSDDDDDDDDDDDEEEEEEEEVELCLHEFPKCAIESIFDLWDITRGSHKNDEFVYDADAGIIEFWFNKNNYGSNVKSATPGWKIEISENPTYVYILKTKELMITVKYKWVR